jgi:hypothetical protein
MKIPKSIIEMYRVHSHIYLDFMEKSEKICSLHNENEIVYYGWKMLLQIMSIMYVLNKTNQETNMKLQEAYLLYLEYIEQIYSKNMLTHKSPTEFVFKTCMGNINLNATTHGHKNKEIGQTNLIFTRIAKWTNIISQWDLHDFTSGDRQILHVAFLTNYLDSFSTDRYEWYRVIENIQDIWSKEEDYSTFHVVLLDKFHKYIMKNKPSNEKGYITNICFSKFVENKEYVTNMISNVRKNKDVDELLTWIFTE